jgi:flagellar hook-associated protein 1 FlgK
MGLGQALTSAISGMRVTQSSLAVISSNIANAETPGYVKKTATQVAAAAGDLTIGVRLSSISRELDQFLQRQLRMEQSGGAYATQRSDFFQRLQNVFGQPGDSNALETIFNNFTSSIQSLATSPDASASRYAVLTAGQTLAQHLNGMTADIQGLRTDAELGLSDAVNQANAALRNISDANQQLGLTNVQDATTATLRDRRDFYIDQLSQLMDIKVVETDHNQISIFSRSGAQLVGGRVAQIMFDAKGSLSAVSQWSIDPTKRSVGTLLLDSGAGTPVDMIATNMFGSGKIAALLEMRDDVLVEAQAQVDQIAAAMSRSLSDRTVAGTAASFGSQSGFDVDIGALKSGNTVKVTYTDNLTNTQRTVTLVRVDDPSVLPLPATTTADPNDKVVGINFSVNLTSAIAQMNEALGPTGMHFSNPSGTTLRVLDNGAGGKVTVNAVSATSTVTSLSGGTQEFPFFYDGTNAYTGAIGQLGSQTLGFAGRICVNASLLADPSKLVVYQTGTQAGDATRPNFMLDRITNGVLDFPPGAGIGTTSAPFSGTLQSYIRQMISQQGEVAATAQSLQEGQEIVVNTLQQRFADQSNVNIDEEMANLLKLQTAYSANARVLTTVRDMLEQLFKL